MKYIYIILVFIIGYGVGYFVLQTLSNFSNNNYEDDCREDYIQEYVKITVYNALPEQTSGNPLQMANGEFINKDSIGRNIAISRNLLDRFNLNDTIWLYCNCPYGPEKYKITDLLGRKAINQVDILVHDSIKSGLFYGQIFTIRDNNEDN